MIFVSRTTPRLKNICFCFIDFSVVVENILFVHFIDEVLQTIMKLSMCMSTAIFSFCCILFDHMCNHLSCGIILTLTILARIKIVSLILEKAYKQYKKKKKTPLTIKDAQRFCRRVSFFCPISSSCGTVARRSANSKQVA